MSTSVSADGQRTAAQADSGVGPVSAPGDTALDRIGIPMS